LTKSDPRSINHPYGSRYGTDPIPKYKIPSKGVEAKTAYQVIHDELTLDGNPQLSAYPSGTARVRILTARRPRELRAHLDAG
jgi:glutamate/tyrosine decarboxylase-like PLP-dependent enzyme